MGRLDRHRVDGHQQLHRALHLVGALVLRRQRIPEQPHCSALGLRARLTAAARFRAIRAERDARVIAAQMLLGGDLVVASICCRLGLVLRTSCDTKMGNGK